MLRAAVEGKQGLLAAIALLLLGAGPLFGQSMEPGDSQENSRARAVEAFQRLRLRQPMAEAFETLGMDGESCWRAAARVNLALLPQEAGEKAVSKPKKAGEWLGLPVALWEDPEVRWLVGWNEWQGHVYITKEQYEELIWWLKLPQLCRLTGKKTEDTKVTKQLHAAVEAACAGMAELRYRVDEIAGVKQKPGDTKENGKAKDDKRVAGEKQAANASSLSRRGKSRAASKKARKQNKKRPKK